MKIAESCEPYRSSVSLDVGKRTAERSRAHEFLSCDSKRLSALRSVANSRVISCNVDVYLSLGTVLSVLVNLSRFRAAIHPWNVQIVIIFDIYRLIEPCEVIFNLLCEKDRDTSSNIIRTKTCTNGN